MAQSAGTGVERSFLVIENGRALIVSAKGAPGKKKRGGEKRKKKAKRQEQEFRLWE